jgi:hypothetical protein
MAALSARRSTASIGLRVRRVDERESGRVIDAPGDVRFTITARLPRSAASRTSGQYSQFAGPTTATSASDSDRSEEPDLIETNPTDAFDLAHPEAI